MMQTILRSRPRAHTLILFAIVLIGGLARTHLLLQIEHNIDHAYPIWQALMTLDHGVFPLVGQNTSVLFANPALTGYLFLPLIALVRLPIAPYLLTIPLNTLGVLLAYRALRSLIGVPGALIAAFLMAVNPWMIEYSRTSWVQSLLPFFVPALAWALFPVLMGKAKRPARRLMIAFVVLTMVANTYLLAYALVIPVGVLLVIFRARVRWRAVIVGAALFAAGAALYGIGLIGQESTVAGRVESFASSAPHLSSEAWSHAVRLVTGKDYAAARGTLAPIQDSALRQNLSEIAHAVVLALILIGIAAAAIKIVRRRDPASIILLVWFFVPILLMSDVGQVIHPFYQLIGIPAGVGLAALGAITVIEITARVIPRTYAYAGLAALCVPFGALMLINSARYYEDTAVTPGIDGLTALPLDWGMRLGQDIRDLLPPGGTVYSTLDQPFILSSFAGEALDYVPFHSDEVTIYPAAGGVDVQMLDSAPGASASLRARSLPDGTTTVVQSLQPAASVLNSPGAPAPIPSDQGIAFAGSQVGLAGDHWNVDTFWLVQGLVDRIDSKTFGMFAHVFDSMGNRIEIVSADVVPGIFWRIGDVQAVHLSVPYPTSGTAPYTIGVGIYDPNQQVNAIFVTPDGQYMLLLTLPGTYRAMPSP